MEPKLKSGRGLLRRLARWVADERGNIGPLLAIMVVPIIGAFAVGGETSSWFMMHRSQQNAADSAVIAAALKGSSGYATEGRAVAKSYGFTDGSNNVVVTPTTITCPSGATVISGSTCYQVTVTRTVPVYLTRVVGYSGDGPLGSGTGKLIKASAVAGLTNGTNNFCLIGLNSITLNGGPGTNLTGCDLLSGGGLACNGQNSDFGVVHGYAVGANKGDSCGTTSVSGYTGFSGDPEATTIGGNISDLSSALSSCSATASITSLSSGVNCFSPATGSLKLGGNVTVTSPDTVLVLKNSSLNLQNFTLQTAPGASLTIVYVGATGAATGMVLQSSGGGLDIAAPSGGAWKGIAFAEDPGVTGVRSPLSGEKIQVNGAGKIDSRNLDFSGSGQSISFKITGLIYLPNADFNFTGSIDHATNSDNGTLAGQWCLGIIANNIVASGTNTIFSNPTKDCRQAGLTLPTVPMISLLQ